LFLSMVASEFFKNHITDNNYRLDNIASFIELNEDFNCSTYNRKISHQSIRRNGIEDFIKGIRQNIESHDLSTSKINFINRDEEFDANQDQKIIEILGDSFESFKIKTGNIVGSLIYKGNQLNINCRFGNSFLEYMIANTSGFIELENFGGKNDDLGLGEWILILYWKMRLKKAFTMGMYKNYKTISEEIPTIRGSIDINSFIKKPFFNGKTTCVFKEYSYENNINRIIKQAITKVAKSKYNNLISDVVEIKRAYDNVHFNNGGKFDSAVQVRNPYYLKYNEVFDLSKNIVEDNFLSYNNPKSDFSAFIFDVSLLFEHHIRKVLKQKFDLHKKNKTEFKIPNGIDENKLFPDVIIDYGDNKIGIFDVKYKHFRLEGKDRGVNREDRFQLITYLALYTSKYDVVNSGFIYPCKNIDYEEVIGLVSKQNQYINVGENQIPFSVYFYQVNENYELQRAFDKEFSNEFYINSSIEEMITI